MNTSPETHDDDAHDPDPQPMTLRFPAPKPPVEEPFSNHAPDVDPATLAHLQAQLDIESCRDPLERILLARVAQTAARLDKSARAEVEGPNDTAWHRYEAQADRSFRSTFTLLMRLRQQTARHERDLARAQRRSSTDKTISEEQSESLPVEGPPPIEPPCPPDWRERLVIDPDVRDDWPVVRGTRLWADHVAAMIEDGWTLASMLREYPQLSPGDVAACRHADSIGLCGPWPDGVAPPPRCHKNLPGPRPGPGTFPFPDSDPFLPSA